MGDYGWGHKSHGSTNKMSLSATFPGLDWKTSDNPLSLSTRILNFDYGLAM